MEIGRSKVIGDVLGQMPDISRADGISFFSINEKVIGKLQNRLAMITGRKKVYAFQVMVGISFLYGRSLYYV